MRHHSSLTLLALLQRKSRPATGYVFGKHAFDGVLHLRAHRETHNRGVGYTTCRYDLPDLAAAWVVGAARSSHRARVVMLGPVDEMLHPLNATAMTTTYRFVTVAAERVAGELATVQMVAGVPSPADVVAAVLGALGPLPGSWE